MVPNRRSFLGVHGGNARSLALALSIGGAGGAVFFALSLPLAWMLGAMVAVTAISLGGLRMVVPGQFRAIFAATLGVLLGSAFTPDLVNQISKFGTFLGLQAAFMLLATTLAYQMHRRLGGYDRVTAYFSSTPGGLF